MFSNAHTVTNNILDELNIINNVGDIANVETKTHQMFGIDRSRMGGFANPKLVGAIKETKTQHVRIHSAATFAALLLNTELIHV